MIFRMEPIELGSWIPWARRHEIPRCDLPGVYLLGQFERAVPSVVDPADAAVVYVGETCDQTLEKRWYQFNRAAFFLKPGHSGGLTFAFEFCGNKVVEPVHWLHVAAYPVDLKEPRRSAHIRYVERMLLWCFVERHNQMPKCNRK